MPSEIGICDYRGPPHPGPLPEEREKRRQSRSDYGALAEVHAFAESKNK